jgi:hypothetical protein
VRCAPPYHSEPVRTICQNKCLHTDSTAFCRSQVIQCIQAALAPLATAVRARSFLQGSRLGSAACAREGVLLKTSALNTLSNVAARLQLKLLPALLPFPGLACTRPARVEQGEGCGRRMAVGHNMAECAGCLWACRAGRGGGLQAASSECVHHRGRWVGGSRWNLWSVLCEQLHRSMRVCARAKRRESCGNGLCGGCRLRAAGDACGRLAPIDQRGAQARRREGWLGHARRSAARAVACEKGASVADADVRWSRDSSVHVRHHAGEDQAPNRARQCFWAGGKQVHVSHARFSTCVVFYLSILSANGYHDQHVVASPSAIG